MSQSGLLNEDEIKDYINETFGLKLDRNVFIKPTSEVVIDIYTKFLDYFFSSGKWRIRRSQREDFESNIMPMIVRHVRKCVANYDINLTFNFSDLLMPDALAILQQLKNDRTAEQEAIENMKRERSTQQQAIEELAFKIASSKSIDELIKEKEEKELAFNQLKKRCDDLREKAMHVKANNKVLSEKNAQRKTRLEESDRRVRELENQLQMLNDGQGTKDKIHELERTLQITTEQINNLEAAYQDSQKKIDAANRLIQLRRSNNDRCAKYVDNSIRLLTRLADDKKALKLALEQEHSDLNELKAEETSLQAEISNLEQQRSKVKLQFKTKEQQSLIDRNARAKQREELVQQSDADLLQVRQELERLRKESAEEITKQKAISEQREILAAKVKRQLEHLESYVNSKKDASSKKDTSVTNHIRRLESLVGKPKEIELPPNSNQTYIKESYELEAPKNLTFNKKD